MTTQARLLMMGDARQQLSEGRSGFLTALGASPTSNGTSEGYLGIVLDNPGLRRTNQVGENDAH